MMPKHSPTLTIKRLGTLVTYVFFYLLMLFIFSYTFFKITAVHAQTPVNTTPPTNLETSAASTTSFNPLDTLPPELTPEELISSFVPKTDIDTSLVPANLLEFGVTVDLTPELPGPFEDVVVRLISYNVDLNRSNIVWELNGKTILSGKGETKGKFRTGAIGSQTTLTITVAAPDGRVTTKETRIVPASVDLVWQSPGSYVPPFYKGKALYSHQGSLQVIALPTLIRPGGARINPKNLIYKWYRGSTVINDQSGYGKSSVVIQETTPADEMEIGVKVSTEDGSITASQKISITSTNPKVLLYDNKPLEGVRYDQAMKTDSILRNTEAELRAVPYFFSGGSDSNNLNFSWYVNNYLSPGQIKPSVLVRNSEKEGFARIKALISSKDKIFQRSSYETLINMKQ